MSAELPSFQKQRWQDDGYLKVEGFLQVQEIMEISHWVEEISSWPVSDKEWMHHRERTAHGDVQLARTENFVPFHSGMKRLLTAGRLIAAAGELMDQPAVLYKEKINYKHPGGGGYAAHQDAPAYEYIKRHITCLVTIDPMNEQNGCLYFSPGRHEEGLISIDDRGCIDVDAARTMDWVPVLMEPGDVLFFHSYAPHMSPPNDTSSPRRALYLTYNAAAEGDFREQYYNNKREAFAKYKLSSSGKEQQISKIGHFQGRTVIE